MKNKEKVELPKVATGIEGLDEVLNGGLAKRRATLVSGGTGCGKSILGLEFLYRGALAGDSGIFITFEERAESVRQNALTLGWDLADLEKKRKSVSDGSPSRPFRDHIWRVQDKRTSDHARGQGRGHGSKAGCC